MTAGMIVVGVSAWHLARGSDVDDVRAARSGSRCRSCFVAALLTTLVGHGQAQLMTKQQPMKMAAAEALYTTQTGAPFSLFAVAPFEEHPTRSIVRHQHPARPLDPRHELLERQGRGHQRPATRGTRRSTAPGDYAPDHRRHLLVVPDHDRDRVPADPAQRRSGCCCSGGARSSGRAATCASPTCGDRAAVPRQRGRLDLHRDGPPALGRPGPPADRERRLAERLGLGGRHRRSSASRSSTACSRRVDGWLMFRYAKTRAAADPEPTSHAATTARPRDGLLGRRRTMPTGYWHLQTLWFGADRRPLDRLLRARGVRLRRRHAAAVPRQGRRPTGASIINTIGPVWDGNEVWLLDAGGATFAAFPGWYATLFSGFYLALFLILVALIVRGVAFEYRGKHDSPRWRAWWDRAIFVGSALPALLWGVGVRQHRARRPDRREPASTPAPSSRCSTPTRSFAGLTSLALFTLHGAIYLSSEDQGRAGRARARRPRASSRSSPPCSSSRSCSGRT